MSSPASNPRLRINSGVVIAQSMYLQWKKRKGREGGREEGGRSGRGAQRKRTRGK